MDDLERIDILKKLLAFAKNQLGLEIVRNRLQFETLEVIPKWLEENNLTRGLVADLQNKKLKITPEADFYLMECRKKIIKDQESAPPTQDRTLLAKVGNFSARETDIFDDISSSMNELRTITNFKSNTPAYGTVFEVELVKTMTDLAEFHNKRIFHIASLAKRLNVPLEDIYKSLELLLSQERIYGNLERNGQNFGDSKIILPDLWTTQQQEEWISQKITEFQALENRLNHFEDKINNRQVADTEKILMITTVNNLNEEIPGFSSILEENMVRPYPKNLVNLYTMAVESLERIKKLHKKIKEKL